MCVCVCYGAHCCFRLPALARVKAQRPQTRISINKRKTEQMVAETRPGSEPMNQINKVKQQTKKNDPLMGVEKREIAQSWRDTISVRFPSQGNGTPETAHITTPLSVEMSVCTRRQGC